MEIVKNENLTKLDGLNNLSAVSGARLLIYDNDALVNLDGLSNLTHISGTLSIQHNKVLENIDGLNNLSTVGGQLWLRYHNFLSSCCGIYPLLCSNPPACTSNGLGDLAFISDNPLACNTAEDVIAAGVYQNINFISLDLSGNAPGLYLLKIVDQNEYDYSRPVIKMGD